MAVLIKARVLQMYYHYCHNLVTGSSFHADHAFFAANYAALEKDYDSLVEYFISMYGNKAFKTKIISEVIYEQLKDLDVEKMTAEEMYSEAMKQEEEYELYLAKCDDGAALGLSNLLQGLYTAADVRVYKIKQRLG